MQFNTERRGILTGAFLTRQGRADVARQQLPLGVLPASLNATPDSCGECDKECIAACSQSLIYIHPVGHDYAGMPYLDFSATGCTSCGECIEACPSSSPARGGFKLNAKINLDYGKCLTNNDVFCISCIAKCDFGVFKLDERRRLTSQQADCRGCGMCVHACPVNALEVQSFFD